MRLSGKSFDTHFGDALVHVESLTASIEDGRTVVKDNGIPNGYVDGECGCSGEIEVDWANYLLILQEARRAGSWKGMEPKDITTFGSAGDEEARIELFGCLLKISDLLNIDPKGGEKSRVKLPFDVTGRDFVRINGVPYLTAKEIEDLQ